MPLVSGQPLGSVPLSGSGDTGWVPPVLAAVGESLTVGDGLTTLLTTRAAIAEALTCGEAFRIAFGAYITEQLTAQDVAEVAGMIREIIIEVGALTDQPLGKSVLLVGFQDALVATEGLAGQRTLHALITEQLESMVAFHIEGETYYGVCMNVENMAATEYLGFDFNSFARYKHAYYAAKADGIYRLSGDTDDGALIQARLVSGITDFGVRNEKRIPEVFIGMRSDDDLVLKVTTRNGAGEKIETWYQASHDSGVLTNARVKVGKGLKASYWQFEIANRNGADFELDTLEMTPVVLSRKL